MEQTAQPVTAPDLVRRRLFGRWRFRERRALLKRAVRTVFVVMADVGAHDLLQLAAADDQEPGEVFSPQASHPALGVRLRPWRSHGRPDHADPLGAEHLVEAARELAVPVAHEETNRLEFSRASRSTSSVMPRLVLGRPTLRREYVQRRATSCRCQRKRVAGETRNDDQPDRGSERLSAASSARSAGLSLGRAA